MEAEPGNNAGQDLAGSVPPSPSPGEEPRDLDQLGLTTPNSGQCDVLNLRKALAKLLKNGGTC